MNYNRYVDISNVISLIIFTSGAGIQCNICLICLRLPELTQCTVYNLILPEISISVYRRYKTLSSGIHVFLMLVYMLYVYLACCMISSRVKYLSHRYRMQINLNIEAKNLTVN